MRPMPTSAGASEAPKRSKLRRINLGGAEVAADLQDEFYRVAGDRVPLLVECEALVSLVTDGIGAEAVGFTIPDLPGRVANLVGAERYVGGETMPSFDVDFNFVLLIGNINKY